MKLHKKWLVSTQDNELLRHICAEFDISPIVAKILVNRGITTDKDIFEFLNININQFTDPFLLDGMDKAIVRINDALLSNEKITVYGDYDVDGITATYLLYDYLKKSNANVEYYIPDRANEGYGMNNSAIDTLRSGGTGLIITVDVGITAIEETNYAKSHGIDVIITDHHTPLDTLPDAVAVINPKISTDKYPNPHLAGVGVAYKLVYALSGCDKEVLDYYSEAACIGTIADMVPIIGENRFIAAYGLKNLSETKNKGLNALFEVSGIDKNSGITSANISFGIAPRLNAAGRIASAKSSVRLFLTEDDFEAKELAIYLDESNKTRQNEEQSILDEAIKIIEKNKLYENNVIIVSGKGWHHGVIGIVSSKITEKYYRPSAVISFDENGTGKASGRSIPGFNLFNALSECNDFLLKYGGHELAAGFSVSKACLEAFSNAINSYAADVMTEDIMIPKLSIDAELEPKDITAGLIKEINNLEPFGIGNKTPVFCLCNSVVVNIRTHKSGKHAFLTLKKSSFHFEAPAFNMADSVSGFETGDCVDISGTLSVNNFQGVSNPQFIIRDILPGPATSINVLNLRQIFMCLKAYIVSGKDKFKLSEFSKCLKQNYGCCFGKSRLKISFDIFQELDLIKCKYENDFVTISKSAMFDQKCNIEKSELFCSFK